MKNKIIIAGPDEDVNEILDEVLSDSYEVMVTKDGDSTIEAILGLNSELASVLIDYELEPSANDIIKQMSETSWFEDVPFIVFSKENSLKIEKGVYAAGATDFIKVPFDSNMVKRKIFKYAELFGTKTELNAIRSQMKLEDKGETNQSSLKSDADYRNMNSYMIELIGTLVEFRNPENRLHVQRMKGLVKIIGKQIMEMYPECGLTMGRLDDVIDACSIHDIGKIAISDTVLLKPGRLTDEEYELMKSHPLRGVEIIETVKGAWNPEFTETALEIIRHHHEKYDGGGYPDGLKGDELSIEASMVSIADTYDALVNDRVYKKAFPKDVAYNKIITGDCGVFSPTILGALAQCRKKWEDWEEKKLRFDDL